MNTTPRVSINDFLLARIAEDEAYVRAYREIIADEGIRFHAGRLERECEAKRRIVALTYEPEPEPTDDNTENVWHGILHRQGVAVLRALAAVYAEHPDYDPEWRLS